MAFLTAKQEEHSGYTQLTREERYQIYILKKDNYSQAQIAELLGRDKSTISREFADHEGMASDLEAEINFVHPYSSWERGVNENTNGLIQQYFPKSRNLTTVTLDEIEHAMDKLNHRPRKTLGYRTPYEVLFKTRTSLTVALGS